MGAEMGGLQPQAQEPLEPAEAGRGRKESPLEPAEGTCPSFSTGKDNRYFQNVELLQGCEWL